MTSVGSNTSIFVATCASVLHYVIDIFGRDCGVRVGVRAVGRVGKFVSLGEGEGARDRAQGGAGRPE